MEFIVLVSKRSWKTTTNKQEDVGLCVEDSLYFIHSGRNLLCFHFTVFGNAMDFVMSVLWTACIKPGAWGRLVPSALACSSFCRNQNEWSQRVWGRIILWKLQACVSLIVLEVVWCCYCTWFLQVIAAVGGNVLVPKLTAEKKRSKCFNLRTITTIEIRKVEWWLPNF